MTAKNISAKCLLQNLWYLAWWSQRSCEVSGHRWLPVDIKVFICQANSLLGFAYFEMNFINEDPQRKDKFWFCLKEVIKVQKLILHAEPTVKLCFTLLWGGKMKQVCALHQKPWLGSDEVWGNRQSWVEQSALLSEVASTCSFHGVLVGYCSCCLF